MSVPLSSRVLTVTALAVLLVRGQDNWQVTYRDVGTDKYELIMEWDHNPRLSPVVDTGVWNPKTDGVCDPVGAAKSPTDGLLYWVPRFHPKEVPAEVTQKTGVQFASVDWQPCGHKDVRICHAESHYDFHLYYVPLEELQQYTCPAPSPTCKDTAENEKFFSLMNGNIPVSYGAIPETDTLLGVTKGEGVSKSLDFCVDRSSAMPESGVHYGDKSETLNEWKSPVTIMGSYNCKLTFFEPMFSWRWMTGRISTTSWPVWDSGVITYDQKTYKPLPTSWRVAVSESCKTGDGVDCHIKVTVRGERCGLEGCGPVPSKCAQQKDCENDKLTGHLPATPAPTATFVQGAFEFLMTLPNSITTPLQLQADLGQVLRGGLAEYLDVLETLVQLLSVEFVVRSRRTLGTLKPERSEKRRLQQSRRIQVGYKVTGYASEEAASTAADKMRLNGVNAPLALLEKIQQELVKRNMTSEYAATSVETSSDYTPLVDQEETQTYAATSVETSHDHTAVAAKDETQTSAAAPSPAKVGLLWRAGAGVLALAAGSLW